jgi:hypothetical protein
MASTSALALDASHAGLAPTLEAHVGPGGVDYAGLAADPAPLDAYLATIADADLSGAGLDERKAFWINAYNALTLDLMADSYPLASIRDLDGGDPWSARSFQVAGQTINLNDIEHKMLRPMGDPRIHAAINCASRGCPPLAAQPFTAAGLSAQLDQASARWATSNGIVIDRDAKTAGLNQILDWFGDDFHAYGLAFKDIPGVEGKAEAGLNYLAQYLDEDTAAWIAGGGYEVSYVEYDWSINTR